MKWIKWRWAARMSLYNKRWRCWGHCAFTLIFRTPGYKSKINYNYKHIIKTLLKYIHKTCLNC
jgi:hypothetical protein